MENTDTVFNIADLFFDAAKKHPDKPAIIFKDQKVTFSKFEQQVMDTMQYFLQKGIAKGDRVLVFVPMSIDLYRIVLALFKIGATAVFLDEWVSKKRLEECCKVAKCKGFTGIFKARVLGIFSKELREIPIKLGTSYSKVNHPANIPRTLKEDTALITFTTGTTGIPKAAVRTHGFLFNQFMALKKEIEPSVDDVSMPVLPIVLLINLATGTTSVISDFKASKPNSLHPEKVVQDIEKYGVNTIIASPFFVKKLSAYIIDKKISISQLRKIFTGGAPVFPTEAAVYNQAFPGAQTTVVYGSTEAEPISTITVKRLLAYTGSILNGLNVGQPTDCAQVRIITITDDPVVFSSAEEFRAIILPPNTVGEIIVSGNHVLRQYLNNETALLRNKIFIGEECWHRTGDSGYLDQNGDLFLMGRCNNIIQNNGHIVYPFVYESYFQTINGVEIGTVLLHENKITAVIQLNGKTAKADVEAVIKATNLQIEQVIFVKSIPRDPRHNSKINYQQLMIDIK